MVVRLRRVRQVVDESDRHAVARHAHVAREHRTGRKLQAEVRTARVDCSSAGQRVVGLNVLLQLQAQVGHVTGFDNECPSRSSRWTVKFHCIE